MQYWEQNTAKKEQKPRESTLESHHSVEKETVEIYSGLHPFFLLSHFLSLSNSLRFARSSLQKRDSWYTTLRFKLSKAGKRDYFFYWVQIIVHCRGVTDVSAQDKTRPFLLERRIAPHKLHTKNLRFL